MRRASYVPRSGSFQCEVVEYYIDHPETEMTTAELVEKFGVPSKQVFARLQPCIEAGYLVRGRNDAGRQVWRRGPCSPVTVRRNRSLEELGAISRMSQQRAFSCALSSDGRMQLNIGGAEMVLMPTETTRLIRYLARMGEGVQEAA